MAHHALRHASQCPSSHAGAAVRGHGDEVDGDVIVERRQRVVHDTLGWRGPHDAGAWQQPEVLESAPRAVEMARVLAPRRRFPAEYSERA